MRAHLENPALAPNRLFRRARRDLFLRGLGGVVFLAGCVDDPCVESISAQVDLPELGITLGPSRATAEIADEDLERARGWRHRRCDRELLALLPDDAAAPAAPLPVFGCALTSPVDVVFVRDDTVVDVVPLAPCPEPCAACPLIGENIPVHAVFEAPSGTLDVSVDDTVTWDGDPRAVDETRSTKPPVSPLTRDRITP